MNRRKKITFVVNSRGCHICTSHHIGTHGYPSIWKDGRNQNMHRVLYEEEYGKLPTNILVRHTCDDRACINLGHFISGTRADNTTDMIERNRQNPPIGERSGTAKLNGGQIDDIRKIQGLSQYDIAIMFGVNQSTVSRILNRKRWKEIN